MSRAGKKRKKFSIDDKIKQFFLLKGKEAFSLDEICAYCGDSQKERDAIIALLERGEKTFFITRIGKKFQLQVVEKKHSGVFSFLSAEKGKIISKTGDEFLLDVNSFGGASEKDVVTLSEIRLNETISKKTITKITEITEKNKVPFVGTVKTGKRNQFFIHCKRLGYGVDISKKSKISVSNGDKVQFFIEGWKAGKRFPFGKIIKNIGRSGDTAVEEESIFFAHNISRDFPKELQKEAKRIQKTFVCNEKGRIDFRDKFTMTIDPEDAKDFDDAISFSVLPKGNFEIGVHIADVSEFVEENTFLDKEAFKRGNSVYLADKTIPMLPEELSNDLCSLKPNVDRYSFSVIFEVAPDFSIQNHVFSKTIIHSDVRFSYDEVQKVIETKKGNFSENIQKVYAFTKFLRKKRLLNGAINFKKR